MDSLGGDRIKDIEDNVSMSKPSNYLQEIKETVDAINGLYNELITKD